MRSNPDAAVAVCASLAARLRATDERLAEIVFLDLPARLARRLAELARTHGRNSPEGIVLDLPLSQRELAELTGATRQSVNQVLSRWEQDGVVRRGRRSLVILEPGMLR
jgi:CRP-like cAMP-binding protein